jgi:pilus assembly protein Flp/PilA
MRRLLSLFSDENGATAIEYGLIAAIISIALVAGFGSFADALVEVFAYITQVLTDAWN